MLLNGGEDRTAVINLRDELGEIDEFLKSIEAHLEALYTKQQPFREHKYSLDEYFDILNRYNQVDSIEEYYYWEKEFPLWCSYENIEKVRDNKIEFVMFPTDVLKKFVEDGIVLPFVKKVQLVTIFSKPHIDRIYKGDGRKMVKRVAPNAVIEVLEFKIT